MLMDTNQSHIENSRCIYSSEALQIIKIEAEVLYKCVANLFYYILLNRAYLVERRKKERAIGAATYSGNCKSRSGIIRVREVSFNIAAIQLYKFLHRNHSSHKFYQYVRYFRSQWS